MSSLQVFLIRHGETNWTLSGQHTGRTDIALTTHGESEAHKLLPRLAGIQFAHVLVSPSLRARQTCELTGLGWVSEIEPDLAEWDYGDYEGLVSDEIWKTRPNWNAWRDGSPGGEMPADVCLRVDRLISRLNTMHGNIALFSHGQLGTSLAARWIGLPIAGGEHFILHTASLSILGHDARHSDQPVISLWNETAVVNKSA